MEPSDDRSVIKRAGDSSQQSGSLSSSDSSEPSQRLSIYFKARPSDSSTREYRVRRADDGRGYRDASADLINLLDCHAVAVVLDRFRGGREIISVARPEMASRRSSRRLLDLLANQSCGRRHAARTDRRSKSAQSDAINASIRTVKAIEWANWTTEEASVAQLIVRDLSEDLVKALKQRAAKRNRSTEQEHREILQSVLRSPKRRHLADVLAAIPNVGELSDFGREQTDKRG
jgi:antitoxin FitA